MVNDTQVKKVHPDETLTSIGIQLQWIEGLRSQVQWLNRPDILTDYVLQLRIYRKASMEREGDRESIDNVQE